MSSAASTHRPLGFGRAFRLQFRLLWHSRRPLVLLLGLVAVLLLAGDPWSDDAVARLVKPWPIWLMLVGPIWGFAVLYNEGPSNRLYHWSLPVDRTLHMLARLAAGAAWLWAAYLFMVGMGLLMAGADGHMDQIARIDPAAWLNLFTAPLIGYLLISVLTVASDYPLRWFFGILVAVPLVTSLVVDWFNAEEVADFVLKPLGADGWGLFPIMVGRFANLAIVLDREARGQGAGPMIFDAGYFWPATALWILLIAGIVAFMASRHPDTLPRLRRPG